MAVITIDGVRLEVPDQKNVLDCALEAGIYIPHLCHHPNLPENGSCRMCIVEVEGEKEVVTSCTLKAKNGLNIKTKSEKISKLRMLGLELLLGAHPEDCSTCPKYGNCELQTLIQYIGANNGRMRNRAKGFKMEEENPLFIHDMNRCVLCGRCVRACNDLRGVSVLQYQKKDLETYVGTLHHKLLKETDCRFCGACAEVCPTGTIRDKVQLLTTNLKRDEALVPCRHACPVHTEIPKYIRFVKEGNYDAAVAVIREKAPFPKSLGYVCNHVCEAECKRKAVNASIAIRDVKRYAAEADTGSYWRGKGKQLPDTGKQVVVVGGGPAGMTAAYYLRKQGHSVTIKEAMPTVGGMMGYGIPAYRLPREIIAEEAQVIKDQGVVIETNAKVDKPLELLKDCQAVLMTIGTHAGVRLPMEGNTLEGTLLNTDFLRKTSLLEETGIGEKVVVLGGGNVAFDCARTAKKLGAKEVHLACLEAREHMLADEEEITEAEAEGIYIHPAQTFEKINGADRVTGVTFMDVKSFTFDENRRAVIEKVEDSEHIIQADTVIFAVGQRTDLQESAGLSLGRGNVIQVEEGSKQTSVAGIFAAGDAIYGTKSVVTAIASGREAAIEIDRYLGGDGDITETLAPLQPLDPYIGKVESFADLERDLGCKEANRCLQCDLRLQIAPARVWGDYAADKKEENL